MGFYLLDGSDEWAEDCSCFIGCSSSGCSWSRFWSRWRRRRRRSNWWRAWWTRCRARGRPDGRQSKCGHSMHILLYSSLRSPQRTKGLGSASCSKGTRIDMAKGRGLVVEIMATAFELFSLHGMMQHLCVVRPPKKVITS
jgi:hypothetical protein